MVVAADPLVAVADKAPMRLAPAGRDPDDDQPRQHAVLDGERNDAGVEQPKRHPPFDRQRPHPMILVAKDPVEILRLDDKPAGIGRARFGRAQFGEAADDVLGRRRDFRVPLGIEILDAKQFGLG